MDVPDGPSVIKFDSFKADILAEAAFTDYWGVWEPFWWLVRGGKVVEGEPEDASAERALRELHADGLLFFFRVPGDRPVKACGED
ncbi:MAG: hypothetical protein ACXVZP_10650, partial [Gaiellaceae bacterium]